MSEPGPAAGVAYKYVLMRGRAIAIDVCQLYGYGGGWPQIWIGDWLMTKILKFLRPFTHSPKEKKIKYCSACGRVATQEACYDVGDGATMIEKYCDACAKNVTRPGR